MTNKITLVGDDLWIIRSTHTFKDGSFKIQYYETPSTWNSSPLEATIFQNYEAAEGHLNMYNKRDKAKNGWADGRKEVFDVVSLCTEILTAPNVKRLQS